MRVINQRVSGFPETGADDLGRSGELPRNFRRTSGKLLGNLWKEALTIAAKIITKKLFTKKCFGTINFVIITKESLYKANSLACFLVKRELPVAATLQRKSSGRIIFVIITKIITK